MAVNTFHYSRHLIPSPQEAAVRPQSSRLQDLHGGKVTPHFIQESFELAHPLQNVL